MLPVRLEIYPHMLTVRLEIYPHMLPFRLDQLTGQVGGVAEGRITATARLLGRGSGPRRGGGLQRKIFVNKVEIGFVLAAFYLV